MVEIDEKVDIKNRNQASHENIEATIESLHSAINALRDKYIITVTTKFINENKELFDNLARE